LAHQPRCGELEDAGSAPLPALAYLALAASSPVAKASHHRLRAGIPVFREGMKLDPIAVVDSSRNLRPHAIGRLLHRREPLWSASSHAPAMRLPRPGLITPIATESLILDRDLMPFSTTSRSRMPTYLLRPLVSRPFANRSMLSWPASIGKSPHGQASPSWNVSILSRHPNTSHTVRLGALHHGRQLRPRRRCRIHPHLGPRPPSPLARRRALRI